VTRALAALLAVLPLLAACASEQERYCALVEDRQEELTEVAADEGRVFDTLPVWRELRSEAPSDIEAEWDLVISALEELHGAVEDAGVDARYDADDPPPGLTEEQRDEIAVAAHRLGSERVVTAMAGLEQHALDVCGTPLSQ
jgi:hypothetical protein